MRKLIFILIASCLIVNTQARGQIKKEFSVSEGGTLDIRLESGGSIDIRGWDEPKASVEVDFHNCDPDDFNFDISQTGSKIEIYSDFERQVHQSNIAVTINVPKKFRLMLKTIGGSIGIYNMEGRIRGKTAGGELDLEKLTGHINLITGGGSITVRDSKLDGNVRTGGGEVLIDNVEGNLDASTGGGAVQYRNTKTSSRVNPADFVNIKSGGGNLNVDGAPQGAELSTGGGDIHIRSAQKSVRAHTGGGTITIDAVDGSVKAITGAGEIDVTMVGDADKGERDVILSSGTGDIMLAVPESFSMQVDIELAYTKGHANDYEIISDFEIQQEKTDRWEYGNGSPRKYIFGKASIQGGRNRVEIRTVNGNVILRKKG